MAPMRTNDRVIGIATLESDKEKQDVLVLCLRVALTIPGLAIAALIRLCERLLAKALV